MSAEYDAIFIGGGHNALTCACYLAKCGLSVLVVERLPFVGGAVKTTEHIPHYKFNTCANSFTAFTGRPPYRDLKLWRYCEMILPKFQMSLGGEDSNVFTVCTDSKKTSESISRISERDGATFLKQDKLYRNVINKFFVAQNYTDPFLRTEEEELDLLDKSPEGHFLQDIKTMSLREHVEETWDSETMKVFESIGSVIMGLEIDQRGSAIALPYQTILRNTYIVKGGSANFALALRSVLVEHGGEVLENAHVEKVLVKNGQAKGVILANGKTILAKRFVVSGVDVKQSFERFVDVDLLPDDWKASLKSYKYEALTDLGIFMALKKAPKYEKLGRQDQDVNEAFRIFIGFNSMEDLADEEREIRNGNYGDDVDGQRFQVLHPTKWDSSQAPADRHVCFIWDFVKCYANEMPDRSNWEELGSKMADLDKAQWKRYATNLNDEDILGTLVYTPADIQRNIINMIGGGILMRSFEMSPRSLPSSLTPIDSYYYCGSGMHPGGAVTMAPGYIAANVISKQEKIEPWWEPVVWGKEYPIIP